MYCDGCGKQNKLNSIYCKYCGYKLSDNAFTFSNPTQTTNNISNIGDAPKKRRKELNYKNMKLMFIVWFIAIVIFFILNATGDFSSDIVTGFIVIIVLIGCASFLGGVISLIAYLIG